MVRPPAVGSVVRPKGRWSIVYCDGFKQIANMFKGDIAVVLSHGAPTHPVLDDSCHAGLYVEVLFGEVVGYVALCELAAVAP